MLPLALLNASILTADGYFRLSSLTTEEAQQLVKQTKAIESAVGHAATAEIMTDLLGVEVPQSRHELVQQPGQQAIVFQLHRRAPEGAILSRADLEKIGYDLKLLTRLS